MILFGIGLWSFFFYKNYIHLMHSERLLWVHTRGHSGCVWARRSVAGVFLSHRLSPWDTRLETPSMFQQVIQKRGGDNSRLISGPLLSEVKCAFMLTLSPLLGTSGWKTGLVFTGALQHFLNALIMAVCPRVVLRLCLQAELFALCFVPLLVTQRLVLSCKMCQSRPLQRILINDFFFFFCRIRKWHNL